MIKHFWILLFLSVTGLFFATCPLPAQPHGGRGGGGHPSGGRGGGHVARSAPRSAPVHRGAVRAPSFRGGSARPAITNRGGFNRTPARRSYAGGGIQRGGTSHIGSARGNWRGGYANNHYRGGGYYNYGNGGYGNGGYGGGYYGGNFFGNGYGYPGYFSGSGLPYGGGLYNSYYNSAYPDYYGDPAFGNYAQPGPAVTMPGYDIAPNPVPANLAVIRVIVPDPQAQVWFDGVSMSSTGTDRYFQTPPLATAGPYSYQIRASSWPQGGTQVTQERTAFVTAGQTTIVDFTSPQ